jgi:hypothetical protein
MNGLSARAEAGGGYERASGAAEAIAQNGLGTRSERPVNEPHSHQNHEGKKQQGHDCNAPPGVAAGQRKTPSGFLPGLFILIFCAPAHGASVSSVFDRF